QLLQRRRRGRQRAYARVGERAQYGVQPVGVDLEPDPVAAHLQVLDAGQGGEAVGRAGELGAHAGAGEVAQVGQRTALHGPALADDAHAVAQLLHLAEDVRGQQHGPAAVPLLGDATLEDLLHQRVEPGGRLVQDQQVDVGGERGDQGDLLPVPLGVGAALLGRVQLEAVDQLGAAARVQAAAQASVEVDDLAAGEVAPERHVAGDVGDPAVDLHGVRPR